MSARCSRTVLAAAVMLSSACGSPAATEELSTPSSEVAIESATSRDGPSTGSADVGADPAEPGPVTTGRAAVAVTTGAVATTTVTTTIEGDGPNMDSEPAVDIATTFISIAISGGFVGRDDQVDIGSDGQVTLRRHDRLSQTTLAADELADLETSANLITELAGSGADSRGSGADLQEYEFSHSSLTYKADDLTLAPELRPLVALAERLLTSSS